MADNFNNTTIVEVSLENVNKLSEQNIVNVCVMFPIPTSKHWFCERKCHNCYNILWHHQLQHVVISKFSVLSCICSLPLQCIVCMMFSIGKSTLVCGRRLKYDSDWIPNQTVTHAVCLWVIYCVFYVSMDSWCSRNTAMSTLQMYQYWCEIGNQRLLACHLITYKFCWTAGNRLDAPNQIG